LQSTAEIACKVLSYFPGLCTNSSRFKFYQWISQEISLSLLPPVIDPVQLPAVPWTPYVNWLPPSIFRVRSVRWPKLGYV
jgi:hypothetical protein